MDLTGLIVFICFQTLIFFVWKKLKIIVSNKEKRDISTIKAFSFFHYLVAISLLIEGLITGEFEILLYVLPALVFLAIAIRKLKFVQKSTLKFFENSFEDEQKRLKEKAQ